MALRRLVLLIFLLAACEHQVTDYPPQPALTVGPYTHSSAVTVFWHSGVDGIATACGAKPGFTFYECSRPDMTAGSCVIHALQPADFNDQVRLALLGHELMHCLGAQHGA